MKIIAVLIMMMLLLFGGGCNSPRNETPDNDSVNQADSLTGQQGSGNENNPAAIPVEVTPVVRGEISSYLLFNSTLETEEMADVYSRIPGLIEKIYVEEGEQVSKNQPLVQIEQDEYILAEEKARLQYDKQLSEYERFQALKDKNLISTEEFETARLSLRQADLQWKQAKLNLDYTLVRSPINGIIGERLIRLGDRIQTTTRLFLVANPQEKVVKIYVPQDELLNCYLKQVAIISTDVLRDHRFTGWVKRISPIVDPNSGTFKVTAAVRDPQNIIRPGMFVTVQLIVDTRENTLLIPKAALFYQNERTYFFLVEKDSVQRLELKKGFEDAEKVEVLNHISDHAKIVVLGQSGLKDGSPVKIVQEKLYHWQKLTQPDISLISDSGSTGG